MLKIFSSYFLLFGLIFVVIPFSLSPYEIPKVLGAILFILALASIIITKDFKTLFNFRNSHFIIFLSLFLLTTYHLVINNSLLLGNSYRPQGSLIYLSLFLLFLITSKLPFNLTIASKLASWSIFLLFFLTLLIGPQESFRFIGPLGEPNALAASALFLLPFLNFSPSSKFKKLALVLAIILIFISGSRAGLLGLFFELWILYLNSKKKIFALSGLILILVTLAAFITPFLPKELPVQNHLKFESRKDIWAISFSAALKSPFLGTGFGSVQEVIHKEAWKQTNLLRFQTVDSTHNLFLNWWAEAGLSGLIILILLIYLSIKNFYQTKSWALLSALIGLLVIQLFNPVSVVSLVHFWWLLGKAD